MSQSNQAQEIWPQARQLRMQRASPEHKEAVTRFVEERAARRASSD